MKHLKKFESFNTIKVSKIETDDVDNIVDILHQSFGHIDDKETIKTKLYSRMINGLSVKATLNNQIVGVYLVAEKSLKQFLVDVSENKLKSHTNAKILININSISDNGLQGIALCVDKDHRGIGIGKNLKDYYNSLNYDYIWGVQDKKLNNLKYWLNSRILVMEDDKYYCTMQNLK